MHERLRREPGQRARRPGLAAILLVATLLLAATGATAAHPFRLACDDGNGNPLAGMPVRAMPVGGGRGRPGTTGDDGVVRFRLPAGRWLFRATLRGYRFTTPKTSIPRKRRGTLSIPLRPVTATLRATFGTQSEPVPDAAVFLERGSDGKVIEALPPTDSHGRVTAQVPERAYRFSASLGGSSARSPTTVWEDRVIDLPGGLLEVTLLHAGYPVPGRPVSVSLTTGGSARMRTSDDRGNVSLILPPGEWIATAPHDGGQAAAAAEVKAGSRTPLPLECLVGAAPGAIPLEPPSQSKEGDDLVSFSAGLSDLDGDGLRLSLHYATVPGEWLPATIDPATLLVSSGAITSFEPGITFPVGSAVPVATSGGPVSLSLGWRAGDDLPPADDHQVLLKLTANDGRNSRELLLPSPWRPAGRGFDEPWLPEAGGKPHQPSLAVDAVGRIHVAWIEWGDAGSSIQYLRWDGTAWTDADGEGVEGMVVHRVSSSYSGIGLAIGADGLPRIAWGDTVGATRAVRYLAWEGDSWRDPLSADGSPRPVVESPRSLTLWRLAIDREGRSHVLLSGSDPSGDVLIHLVLGPGGWTDLDGEGRESLVIARLGGSLLGADLAVNADGVPHAAWGAADADGAIQVHLLAGQGGGWAPLDVDHGSLVFPGGRFPSVGFAPGGHPLIAWEDEEDRVGCAAWEGEFWSVQEVVAHGSSRPLLLTAANGDPRLVLCDHTSGPGLPRVLTRRDGTWQDDTGPLPVPPGTEVIDLAAAAAPDGHAALAYVVYPVDRNSPLGLGCALLAPARLSVDTAPPTAPGAPSVSVSPAGDGVTLTFAEPAADPNLTAYLLEALAGETVTTWDASVLPSLGLADPGTAGSIGIAGLARETDYRFRLVGQDLVGHRAPSPPSATVRLPPDMRPPILAVDEPAPGTATPERHMLVRGTVDEPGTVVTVNGVPLDVADGLFSGRVPLPEGDAILVVRAADPSGNASIVEVPVVSIPFDILTPPSGSSAAGGLIEASGTCGATVKTLSSKGVTLAVRDRAFSLPVPLVPGPNTVVLTAADALGRTSSRPLQLTGLGGEAPLLIESLPPGGAAPLTVTLKGLGTAVSPGSRYSWEPEGPGRPPLLISEEPIMTHRYESPGRYTPSATVTDAGGVVHRAWATVTVHPPARLEAVIPSSRPRGVVLAPDGSLAVSEEGSNSLRLFGADLADRGTVTEAGGVPLASPAGLALDGLGRLWLADPGNRRIVALDHGGAFLGAWETSVPLADLDAMDWELVATADGSPLLHRFSLGGTAAEPTPEPLEPWDLSAPALGALAAPGSLSFAGDRTLLVVDAGTNRLVSWTLRDTGPDFAGPLPWPLVSPSALARCRDGGWVAVADGDGKVLLADGDGLPATLLDSELYPSPPAEPRGVALRHLGQGIRVAVADTGNDRVLVLLVPGEDPVAGVEALRQALLAGDRATVAGSLHPLRRDHLLAFFDLLGDRLAEAAPWFEQGEMTEIRGRTATVRTIRRCNVEGFTGEVVFDVHLFQDDDGHWRVVDF